MKRIILMVLRLFIKVPYYIWHIDRCGKTKEIDYAKNYEVVKKVTKKANKAGRVKVESFGLENIPKDNGFVFFPNHQGLFDVLVFLESCPVPFAFVIKKEASKYILLKQVINALGSIPIDRSDLKQSMRVIQTMADEVKKGRNFLIFAEGTRSKKGNEILDFKPGSFKSAQKAKCPIVPCALIDSFKPFDENKIEPVTVKIIYLPPISYEEYANWKTPEIALEVHNRIEKAIKEYTEKNS